MKLIIVESPAKCDTIKRYLGDDYIVMASLGHIRDLATSGTGGLGVDVLHGFAATYKVSPSKRATVRDLINAKRKADEVILATDPDREGEAIAWHLAQVLKLDVKKTKRLEFHEITRDSIYHAIENPRTIDMDLVASQETRRIIDRIIGFKLSNLLNKKIHSRSAGRVQSATLKIIADREKEIEEFVPQEYWKFNVAGGIDDKIYDLNIKLGKDVKTQKEAQKIIKSIPKKLTVTDVKCQTKYRESKEPFTTSTLQQAAFNKFKYKTKKTQFIAQTLYEGLDIGDEHVGLITYMRTDSTRLSPTFIQRAKSFITEKFGKEYVGKIKGHKGVQDAHEAIRPTGNHRTPAQMKPYLSNEQYNIYKLIYDRAIASLMSAKVEEVTTVTLQGGDLTFTLEGSRTVFPGFEALYNEENVESKSLPLIKVGDVIEVTSKDCEQKFTTPEPRYSEAGIVKMMEKVKIGRPSTYASTISILQSRRYVTDEGGILKITDQGKKTTTVLTKYFPNIVDTAYTAAMEEQLDNIQAGSGSRKQILDKFYDEFMGEMDRANIYMYKDANIPTGEKCPICGKPLVVKEGKNGKFVACSGYPECKYVKKEAKPEPRYTGEFCPECGKPLVQRHDRYGRKFVGCSGFPACHYIKPQKPIKDADEEAIAEKVCPECGAHLVRKKGKYGYFLGCPNFPACHYMEKIPKKQ